MINIFLSFFFAIFSYEFFIVSTNYSFVNRTFMAINNGFIEKSIHISDIDDEVLFETMEIKRNISEYLQTTLTKRAHNIKIGYFFFDYTDNSYCSELFCNSVMIKLECDISYFVTFNKAMKFELVHNV